MSLPQRLIIPLKQHIGAEGELCVKVGDPGAARPAVDPRMGRMLPVHAPTSGTVTAIAPHTTAHPSGLAEMSVIIDADGEDRWIERDGWSDYQVRTREALSNAFISLASQASAAPVSHRQQTARRRR